MSNQKNCLASPTESHSSPLSGVHIIGYYASLSTSSTHEMSKYIPTLQLYTACLRMHHLVPPC